MSESYVFFSYLKMTGSQEGDTGKPRVYIARYITGTICIIIEEGKKKHSLNFLR